MDSLGRQGSGPRRKFLGRFAIPLQPRKVTKENGEASSLQRPFKRPANFRGDSRSLKDVKPNTLVECTLSDSFCNDDILEGLNEIEAQYASTKQQNFSGLKKTSSKNISKGALNDNTPIAGTTFCRRSPRVSKSSNTLGDSQQMERKGPKNQPRNEQESNMFGFTPIGSDTLEAIDAMDLDVSDFSDEITSPGDEQNFNAQSPAIVITPLRSQRKKKPLVFSDSPTIRRSQRLRTKDETGVKTSLLKPEEPQQESKETSDKPVSKPKSKNSKGPDGSTIGVKTDKNANSENGNNFKGNPKELFPALNGVSSCTLTKEGRNANHPLKEVNYINLKDVTISPSAINNNAPHGEFDSEIRATDKNSLFQSPECPKSCIGRKETVTLKSSESSSRMYSNGEKISVQPATSFNDKVSVLVKQKELLTSPVCNRSICGDNSKDIDLRCSKKIAIKPLQIIDHLSHNSIGTSNSSSGNKLYNPVDATINAPEEHRSGSDIANVDSSVTDEARPECLVKEKETSNNLLGISLRTDSRAALNSVSSNENSNKQKENPSVVPLGIKVSGAKPHIPVKSPVGMSSVGDVVSHQEMFKKPVASLDIRNLDSCSVQASTDVVENNRSFSHHKRRSSLDISMNMSKEEWSILSTQAKMELSSWGLPDAVLKRYNQHGIKSMFSWQAECLSLPNVLDGKNLVYSAPTSAGKTLVAELLLLKRVLESGRKGVFILPFVSVAREKMYYLQKMFAPAGIRVEGFMGSQGPPGGLKATDIAVCTIEKANNLINRLLEDKRLNELGAIVVDELHMLGDPHRGYLLELLLTKVMFVSQSSSLKQEVKSADIQIIGMSATLPNLDLLATWLNSQLYKTDFRPVPLTERVKVGKSIFDPVMRKVRDLDPRLTVKGDSDHLIQLCLETVLDGLSVLVFCPTKAWCEKLAESVAKEFFSIGKPGSQYSAELSSQLRESLNTEGIEKVIEALRKCPVGLDKVLGRSISFGAAYHHAGLTFDERDIVEGGFRNGSIRVLVATSTLSSGVNLPARRVIIRSPIFGGSILDTLTYKQMIGRAGRKGVDTEGESILICRDGEKQKAQTLMTSALPAISSCLQQDASLTSSMKRAILEVIVSGIAASPSEVERYCSCTLLVASLKDTVSDSQRDAQNSIMSCVKFLEENEFIRLQEGDNSIKYIGTQLGYAVLASGLSPDEGLHVFSELHRARRCFVLENELHIIYQVTPVYVSSAWPNMDWLAFLSIWESLSDDMKRVAELVGIQESFIIRAMKGVVNRKIRQQAMLWAVHQRFYTALALHELVQEVPLNTVAQKYSASRGMLQSLQQSAATFAGMVTVFSNRLGWHNLELLVAQFHDRLHFGIQRELCDLVRLSCINGQRARYLYNAGLETVSMVAHSNKDDIENILHSATPFHSNKMGEKDSHPGGTIWLSSGQPLTEAQAATLIVEEARQLVQKELGLASIDWGKRDKVITTPNRPLPGLRSGSSSLRRRSSNANRRSTMSPNPILKYEAAGGKTNVSLRILEGANDIAITPLYNRTMKRKSPHVGAVDIESKSPRFANKQVEGASITKGKVKFDKMSPSKSNGIQRNDDLSVAESIPVQVRCGDNLSGNEHKISDNCPENNRTSSPSNDIPLLQEIPPGSQRAMNDNGEGFLKNQRDVSDNTNSKLDNEEVEAQCRERKDSKRMPKNRNWRESNVHSSSRSKLKENISPCEDIMQQSQSKKSSASVVLNDEEPEADVHVKKPSVAGFLFGRSKSKKEVQSTCNQDAFVSFCVPESQEDKSDNPFSPNRKSKRKIDQFSKVKNKKATRNQNEDDRQSLAQSNDKIPVIKVTRSDKVNSSALVLDGKKRSTHVKQPLQNETKNVKMVITDDTPVRISSLKSSTPIAVDATPITDSDAKYVSNLSHQEGDGYSFGSSVANLTFSDPQEFDVLGDEPTIDGLKTKVSTDGDLFDDISFERPEVDHQPAADNVPQLGNARIADGHRDAERGISEASARGSLDFLSKSQREAFLMTMDSQDFDIESFEKSMLDGLVDQDEPEEEPCFSSSCSKRDFSGNNLLCVSHDRVGNNQGSFHNDRSPKMPNALNQEKELGERPLVKKRNLKDRGNCSKGIQFHEIENEEENAVEDKMTEDKTKLPSPGYDCDDTNDWTPLVFEENIADLDACDGDDAAPGNNNSLSDSFFEKAFQTYLHHSQSDSLDADDDSNGVVEAVLKSDGGKKSNEKEVNCGKKGESSNVGGLLPAKNDPQTCDSHIASSKRLSDDLFSSPSPVRPKKHCPLLDSKSEELVQKINQDINSAVPISRTRKGKSSSQEAPACIENQPKPSTSASIMHSQTAAGEQAAFTTNSFCIIDVVGDARVFECFMNEWERQESYSASIACEKIPQQRSKGGIGWRIAGPSRTPRRSQAKEVAGLAMENLDLLIVGLAVCWGGQDAYYINLKTSQEEAISCSLPTPPIGESISFEKRVMTVKEAFSNEKRRAATLITWDAKTFIKMMAAAGIEVALPRYEDPRVASWMLDPGAKEKNIHNMVMNYKTESLPLLESLGSSWGTSSLGINTSNPGSSRVRAATECVVVYHLMSSLKEHLREVGMLQSFTDVEMPNSVTLAYLELNGMGFSNQECESQKAILQAKMESLEQEAYSKVGHPFSLTSPDEISQVLYGELHLPNPAGSGTTSRGGRVRGGGRSKISGPTNKDALEKLQGLHPLPSLILIWRKINSSLTKIVFPLQQERAYNKHLAMDRIHSRTHIFTATGRVTMQDPNLQTVPRDFNIQKVSEENTTSNSRRQKQQRALSNSAVMTQLAPLLTDETEEHTVSLRHALVAHTGNILLAADYSQLELRLLAHLASDEKLLRLLNSGEDVFKMIAAQIHMTEVTDVTTEQRQQAKQVCYGMIYGMGSRALGEQLNLDENEALAFMDRFKKRFPGVQKFMLNAVSECRKNGYVVTLMGRRRYLSNINSGNTFSRSQSERQAVNTMIQGSAADLVKLAMVEIQAALRTTFPSAPAFLTQPWRSRRDLHGAFLVLQLHDELIYEVVAEDVIQVAQLVQKHMEGVQQLAVCLPVNIKVGPSWGSMQTLNL